MVFGQNQLVTRLSALIVLSFPWVASALAQSNPSPVFAPVPVSDAPTKALQVVGNHLFVAAFGRGVQVLDISDPAHPKWAGGWNPRQCPVGIHVVGDYAYVANRTSGLAVLDVRNPANPAPVGSVRYPGDAMAVNVRGRYAYVADYPKGFRIFDVKNPANPVLLGTGTLPQGATSVQALGDYAVFTEPMGLHIFDVRDPLNPKSVGSRKIKGEQYSRVQIVGNNALVAAGQGGLLVLDLTNPADPQPLNKLVGFRPRLATDPYLQGLHVMGRYALSFGAGLEVMDVSDLTKPRSVGRCELNGSWDLRGAGRYAYLMDGGANILVVDLGDPANPVAIGKFDCRNYASPILAVSEIGKSPTPPPVTYPEVPTGAGPPELSDLRLLPDGAFAFTLSGIARATYFIHATTDLISWTTISTNTLPADGRLRITDPEAQKSSHRFYRALKQP